MPIRPNTVNLAEHIGQYVTVARKLRPEKIVSATRTEIKTESGERIRFTVDKFGYIMRAQIGTHCASPEILTDEEAAALNQRADMNEIRKEAATKARKAGHRLHVALACGAGGFTAERLTEIADRINAMFDGNP